jgi:hypothetical protein
LEIFVNTTPDEYWLEDIGHAHQIGAGVFVPFVIARLQDENRTSEALLTVTLRAVDSADNRQEQLRLRWAASSAPT